MRHYSTLLFCFLSISIFSQDFTLNISGGTAVGSFNYDDTIHVFSDRATGFDVFTGWEGTGTPFLDIEDEWHTTLVVPASSGLTNLDLTSSYGQLPPDIEQVTEMISLFGEEDDAFMEGILKEVNYAIPENPKGVVFLFHGTGGRGANMFEKYEIFTLVKDLYHAGYGSISTDANERTLGDQNDDGKIRWLASLAALQTFDNNIDLFNIRALRDTLLERNNWPADFPFYSYGVSNGGNFSDLAAAAVGFVASAHNTANGSPTLYTQRPDATPVIWIQSANDQNASADLSVAFANYQALLDRGICSEWYLLEKSPLYEERFMRSRNNINQQKSTEIYERLFDYSDLLNDENFLNPVDILAELPVDFFDPLDLNFSQISDVQSQLKLTNADHGATGDFNQTIIRFFENICLPSSISFAERNQPFTISPNPSSGFINLNTAKEQIQKIQIFNLYGQLVLQANDDLFSQNHHLNLSHLESGIYTIVISTEKENISLKLLMNK